MQLSGSIFTAAVFMLGGAQGLAMSDMDAIVGQIPLDPFITLGLITFGCGGVGWLLGPIVGTGVFNGMNRKWVAEMAKVRRPCWIFRPFLGPCGCSGCCARY
jgi:import inner membrane translocase subunit TIM23